MLPVPRLTITNIFHISQIIPSPSFCAVGDVIFCSSDIRASACLLCVDHLNAGVTQSAEGSVAKGRRLWSQTTGVECEPLFFSTCSLKSYHQAAAGGGVRLWCGCHSTKVNWFPVKPQSAWCLCWWPGSSSGFEWLARGPVWLGIAVREESQGLAWVLWMKPQCWVQARQAVILANYSQGLHQDSHWWGSHSHLAHFSKLELA